MDIADLVSHQPVETSTTAYAMFKDTQKLPTTGHRKQLIITELFTKSEIQAILKAEINSARSLQDFMRCLSKIFK